MCQKKPEYSYTLREVNSDELPRERLVRLGSEALKDAELLAILFRSGTRQCNAVVLAEQVLQEFETLHRLSQASIEELQQIKGVGLVKAIEIKAAVELGKRMVNHKRFMPTRINNAEDVVGFLMPELRACETERFICVELNTKNCLMKWTVISQGGLDGTAAMPRDVFRQAIRDQASGIIVVHNHPSGDPEPSQPDIMITRRLAQAAELIGLRFLDHIIIGDGKHVSMKNRGLI